MISKHHKINEARAKILKCLKKADKRVQNMYWDINLSWHNCYYHLKELEKIDLVRREDSVWSLTDEGHKILQLYE